MSNNAAHEDGTSAFPDLLPLPGNASPVAAPATNAADPPAVDDYTLTEIVDPRARLEVTVNASGATIHIDGKSVAPGEQCAVLVSDMDTVPVKISAPGYQARLLSIPLHRGKSYSLAVTLVANVDDAGTPSAGQKDSELAALAVRSLLQANEAAREITDPFQKTKAFSAITEAESTLDDVAAAAESLKRARSAADDIEDNHSKHWSFLFLASAAAASGALAEAVRLAEQIVDPYYKALAFKDLGAILAEKGASEEAFLALEHARVSASLVDNESFQSLAFEDIATAYAGAGDFDAALTVAEPINDPFWKVETLGIIAMQQAATGGFASAAATIAQARAIVLGGQDEAKKARALVHTAAALASVWDFEAALAVIAAITDPAWKARGLSSLAIVYATSGDIPSAQRVLKSAREAADLVSFAGTKAYALLSIGAALAATGDYAAAADTVRTIADGHGQVTGFLSIAAAQTNAGDRTGCRESIGYAEDAAHSIGHPASRAWTYALIAQEIARMANPAYRRALTSVLLPTL